MTIITCRVLSFLQLRKQSKFLFLSHFRLNRGFIGYQKYAWKETQYEARQTKTLCFKMQ